MTSVKIKTAYNTITVLKVLPDLVYVRKTCAPLSIIITLILWHLAVCKIVWMLGGEKLKYELIAWECLHPFKNIHIPIVTRHIWISLNWWRSDIQLAFAVTKRIYAFQCMLKLPAAYGLSLSATTKRRLCVLNKSVVVHFSSNFPNVWEHL